MGRVFGSKFVRAASTRTTLSWLHCKRYVCAKNPGHMLNIAMSAKVIAVCFTLNSFSHTRRGYFPNDSHHLRRQLVSAPRSISCASLDPHMAAETTFTSVWTVDGEREVKRCTAGEPLSSPQGFLLAFPPGAISAVFHDLKRTRSNPRKLSCSIKYTISHYIFGRQAAITAMGWSQANGKTVQWYLNDQRARDRGEFEA